MRQAVRWISVPSLWFDHRSFTKVQPLGMQLTRLPPAPGVYYTSDLIVTDNVKLTELPMHCINVHGMRSHAAHIKDHSWMLSMASWRQHCKTPEHNDPMVSMVPIRDPVVSTRRSRTRLRACATTTRQQTAGPCPSIGLHNVGMYQKSTCPLQIAQIVH